MAFKVGDKVRIDAGAGWYTGSPRTVYEIADRSKSPGCWLLYPCPSGANQETYTSLLGPVVVGSVSEVFLQPDQPILHPPAPIAPRTQQVMQAFAPLMTVKAWDGEKVTAYKPPSACECGAYKVGIKERMAGHSPWCPVAAQ